MSELAVSSSCPSDASLASLGCVPSAPCSWLTPFPWDPVVVLCGNAGKYFSDCWQQRLQFGGSLWPRQGDLLWWSWQRSLQLFLYDSVQLWTCLFYLYLQRVRLKIGYVLLPHSSFISAQRFICCRCVHITVLYLKDESCVQVPLVPQHQLDQSDVSSAHRLGIALHPQQNPYRDILKALFLSSSWVFSRRLKIHSLWYYLYFVWGKHVAVFSAKCCLLCEFSCLFLLAILKCKCAIDSQVSDAAENIY